MPSYFPLCILLFMTACQLASSSITCRDENNNPVDWFVVYKLPRLKHNAHPLIHSGIGYYYMDSTDPHFSFSPRNLSLTDHAIANTLRDVYKRKDDPDVGYVLYNDQIPSGGWSRYYGHTKGDLILDRTSGWWLVHSLPHFPPKAADGYSLPHNAYYYGQSFLCLSLDVDEFEVVGEHLLYTFPWAYDFKIPEWMQTRFPHLWSVVNGKHVQQAPWSHVGRIATKKGLAFQTFGKATDFGSDLYHDLVAPSLLRPLAVETWRNDRKVALPSNCSRPFDVYNVAKIDFKSKLNVSFSYHLDHSKWAITPPSSAALVSAVSPPSSAARSNAVSFDSSKFWFCLGGINRESSQFHRAGGTVCCQMPAVWTQFHRIIARLEPCE